MLCSWLQFEVHDSKAGTTWQDCFTAIPTPPANCIEHHDPTPASCEVEDYVIDQETI